MDDRKIVAAIRSAAHELDGRPAEYDPLIELIGDARFVLLGEASHGTHEFYAARAAITRRLIVERGFLAVAAEADWPHADRVNRFVRGGGDDPTPETALGDFGHFPSWMWRNADVRDFVGWLRDENRRRPAGQPAVGFYGLDLYSLHSSIAAVIDYLDRIDPAAARRARDRYACFEHFGRDPQTYGYLASAGDETCADEVVAQLVELQRLASADPRRADQGDGDGRFYAEQNARLVKNAEQYYRSMFYGRESSWNVRDLHMAETLGALAAHLEQEAGRPAKIVLWAHNSHLGDARATEMGERGELNLGQLVRERYDGASVLIGFSTASGTVTAAHDWDQPPRVRRVRTPLPKSYEALFHAAGLPRFLLTLRGAGELAELLRPPRLQRAIGVVYRPDTERVSHYYRARLPEQFDAMLHFDETRAVEPLDARERAVGEDELPETYPSGE